MMESGDLGCALRADIEADRGMNAVEVCVAESRLFKRSTRLAWVFLLPSAPT